VDEPERLAAIAESLAEMAKSRLVVFPVHPRTRERLKEFGLSLGKVKVLEPVGYTEMLSLIDGCGAVVTDSGGVQEETTALGVPCFTLRENTERPITITEGTNQLVSDPALLPSLVLSARRSTGHRAPEGWDGRAGERIVQALVAHADRLAVPALR
jgi:UDP-N-acetylglucosamine 2-epimerase (non-hydrolysing)